MSHPGEKLHPVSTWASRPSETIGEVVDKLYGVIFFRGDWSASVDNRKSNRRCGAAEMPVPLCGLNEAVRDEEDSFRRLLLVKPLHRTFAKSLNGCLAHPTPTEGFLFYVRRFIIKSEGNNDLRVIEMGQCEHEATRHDVAYNALWPIRVYPGASIEQFSSYFVRVQDDNRLTGYIEIDEITCSDPVCA